MMTRISAVGEIWVRACGKENVREDDLIGFCATP